MKSSQFVVFVLFAAGCYNPGLATPGFFCHAGDNPACPDGQQCVSGRCVSPHGGHTDGGIMFSGDMSVNGSTDLAQSGGSTDLAHMVSHDFAQMGGLTGCNGYAQCLLACGSNSSCPPTCDANVTADGMSKFQTALGCGQNYCISTSGECMVDSTGTMLVDPTGAPPGTCNACLNDALAMLFKLQCSSPFAPDCNPSLCTSDYQTCLNSTP
ncbi:MAG TPA: hypothetical protein VFF06_28370 [Polyangia bacterium]|nr:hypothetical protein [Polyangia bacterium]